MKSKLTYIIAILSIICSSILILSCSKETSTFTASYTAAEGGYVYYIDQNGHKNNRGSCFVVNSGDDLAEVTAVTYKGYEFEKWSDGVKTATRRDTNVTADIDVQAIFKKVECYVKYGAFEIEGYIAGKTSQTISPGADAEMVTAVPNEGYIFVGWSDGVTTATRHDTNITTDIEVSAKFKKEEYTLSFIAGDHGSIDGEAEQTVAYKNDGSTVTAVPDKGYYFVKWSDGTTLAQRTETDITESLKFTAEFAPISREYPLNYRTTLSSEINKPILTLTYDAFDSTKLPVPQREHFIFCGWYYGEQQIADKYGNLIVDDDFVLDEVVQDTFGKKQDITAKWTAEETFPFKILIVYVTRIQARLYDLNGTYHNIDFTMTKLQRQFCEASTKLLKQTMDDLCDGLVDFQIDEYYTTQTITNEHLWQSNYNHMHTDLMPSAIPEIQGMRDGYDTVVSVFGFGGDHPDSKSSHLFQDSAGNAWVGECEVYLDAFIGRTIVDLYDLTDILNGQGKSYWLDGLRTFGHEIAHSIELRINAFSFHKSTNISLKNRLNAWTDLRLYYTYSMEYEGQLVGIPYEFWKGDIAHVEYKTEGGGSITFSDEVLENVESNNRDDYQEVIYGWDARAVKADPGHGHRFVRWSDGVTTPERKDRNITGDFTVTAIFEPIVYTIKVVASEGGSVRAAGSYDLLQNVINYEFTGVGYTEWFFAVPQEGYRFVGWSDGTTANQWVKCIQITDLYLFDENNTYVLTAIFEKIE